MILQNNKYLHMKNLFVILSLGFLVASCSKKDNKETSEISKSDSLVTKNEFVIDSVRVQDSLVINKNLTAEFNRQLLVFPSIRNKVILDSIYKELKFDGTSYDANSLKAALTKQMQKSFTDTKKSSEEWSPEFKQTWDESSAMKVVSHRDDILTLKYFGSGYSGGAHGYYFENYKAFDLKNNKVISQADIFKNPADANWNKILQNHFDEPEQKEMLLVDKIELNNNFYFDQNKITFVYNQYEITAYAAGVVYITLNFKDIKDQLKPEFVSQYKIK
ncbi:MAG: hypothetical protein DI529_06725 [Chryseobacterium sp.]|nr:MAG: hypothetical protein DI529_06725 [Chryseobacterium sp.]